MSPFQKIMKYLGFTSIAYSVGFWIWFLYQQMHIKPNESIYTIISTKIFAAPASLALFCLWVLTNIISIYFVVSYPPFRRGLYKMIKELKDFISLSLVGHILTYRKVNNIDSKLEKFLMSSFIARYFRFDQIKKEKKDLYFLFSQRDTNAPSDENIYENYREHRVLPPFNMDEASFIMKTWFQASSFLDWEKIHFRYASNGASSFNQENLIIFGSIKYNRITEVILKKAGDKVKYYFERFENAQKGTEVCITCSNGADTKEQLRPTLETPEGEKDTDYALITRMPNPFNTENYAFIFAGCKLAGHLAAEQLFFNTTILETLAKENPTCTLEVVVETTYTRHSNIPKLEEIKIIRTVPENLLASLPGKFDLLTRSLSYVRVQ